MPSSSKKILEGVCAQQETAPRAGVKKCPVMFGVETVMTTRGQGGMDVRLLTWRLHFGVHGQRTHAHYKHVQYTSYALIFYVHNSEVYTHWDQFDKRNFVGKPSKAIPSSQSAIYTGSLLPVNNLVPRPIVIPCPQQDMGGVAPNKKRSNRGKKCPVMCRFDCHGKGGQGSIAIMIVSN